MIKAVVFDFDGLILDTESAEFASYQAMYRQYGGELTLEVWGACIGTGPGVFDPYKHLVTSTGCSIDLQAARAMRRAYYQQLMQAADLRPGVVEYLQEAKRLGLRVGLASSSTREWVAGYLKSYGILDFFDCMFTRDDVKHVKPAPELYLRSIEALGVEPAQAVAFEDSPNGALAAERAGLRCVIVPNAVTKELRFGGHDLRLDSMEQEKLEAVLAKFNARF